MTPYERTRYMLNPFRDAKAPFQSEMVQWNDGYDKGFFQAKREADTKYADYEMHKEQNLARMMHIHDLEKMVSEMTESIARLRNFPDKKDQ